MIKMVVFDMDGTLNRFYDVPDWLPKLRASDTSPYAEAKPMWDMEALADVLNALQNKGITVAVVTWLGMGASDDYKKASAKVKREWLNAYNVPFDKFHAVQYGATKADSVRRNLRPGEEAVLFDDSAKVRQGWHLGPVVDPTRQNIIEVLNGFLTQ